jgi:hypothetical protein
VSLTYTRDLPTKPGWYWCKKDRRQKGVVCELWMDCTGRACIIEGKRLEWFSRTEYRWFAGPIEEPKT